MKAQVHLDPRRDGSEHKRAAGAALVNPGCTQERARLRRNRSITRPSECRAGGSRPGPARSRRETYHRRERSVPRPRGRTAVPLPSCGTTRSVASAHPQALGIPGPAARPKPPTSAELRIEAEPGALPRGSAAVPPAPADSAPGRCAPRPAGHAWGRTAPHSPSEPPPPRHGLGGSAGRPPGPAGSGRSPPSAQREGAFTPTLKGSPPRRRGLDGRGAERGRRAPGAGAASPRQRLGQGRGRTARPPAAPARRRSPRAGALSHRLRDPANQARPVGERRPRRRPIRTRTSGARQRGTRIPPARGRFAPFFFARAPAARPSLPLPPAPPPERPRAARAAGRRARGWICAAATRRAQSWGKSEGKSIPVTALCSDLSGRSLPERYSMCGAIQLSF